ncbi:ATP-dependent RNA helicase DED1 [Pseudocercospora fuligena]|uniref:ATP-dependent RNA helicase DED1 n=1 Tax=Pseudocercospora fuligena TaxID=685502 RepID=A0A8H6VEW9_9PEZI|nr:ATP-dependent RNA helicase DED1 [Pseudocercospora fuligena]
MSALSTTYHGGARQLACQYMEDQSLRVCVGRAGQADYDLLSKSKPSRILISCNSRIADYLYNNGLPTTVIHSERSQREREDSLRRALASRSPILIATCISARG